jgi:hypothetical protein
VVPERKTDWISLAAGLLFLVLGVAFILRGTGQAGFDVMWVLPVLGAGLVAIGAARAVIRTRNANDQS